MFLCTHTPRGIRLQYDRGASFVHHQYETSK